MPRVTTRDGRVVEWRGSSICWCSTCEELFSSPTAFDVHIRTDKATGERVHDVRNMPRNSKGHLVSRLRDEERFRTSREDQTEEKCCQPKVQSDL
jgi:hypothetical protein